MNHTVSSRAMDVSGFVDRIVRPLTRILNPLIMRVAGGRWVPMFSVLHHRGRRSGRMYATPVSAMPRGGYFWLGMTFGSDAGWARNILASGEGMIRYRAHDYQLIEAVALDTSTVCTQLPPVMRFGLTMLRVNSVVRMRPTNS